jgi:hypothetical protein
VRLFALLVVLGLALIFIWWFTHTPPERVARVLRRALLWAGGGLLIFLAATGRLPSLFALLGALAPFAQRILRLLQFLPLLSRLTAWFRQSRSRAGPSGGRISQVNTRFLRVTLDHDSGAMAGEVLEGRFQGQRLEQLSLQQLMSLMQECAVDSQSAAVLAAYLDREHGDTWRDGVEAGAPGAEPPPTGPMTREEAYQVLGLSPGADRQAILEAHRRLMQKLHPDRGGSTYLAAQINKAKDLLIGEGKPG